MFKNEIGTIGRIDTLVDRLNHVTDDLWNDLQDLDKNRNDFLLNEDMLDGDDADWIFRDMVKSEQYKASLTKFDRVLNQLIAERRKLGNFTITL